MMPQAECFKKLKCFCLGLFYLPVYGYTEIKDDFVFTT